MPLKVSRWEWFELVMGPHGPADHRARLTAVAIFAHMNDEATCYVGQPRLAQRTGFAERSIRRHVQSLEAAGWILRSFVKDAGKAWRKTVYAATVPDAVAAAANRLPEQVSGAANELPDLAEAAANRLPEQDAAARRAQLLAAADLNEGAAKSSEGAANLSAGAANGWPLNRDLNRDVEPVSRTSSAIAQKSTTLLKSPRREPKNALTFDEVKDRVAHLLYEHTLRRVTANPHDYDTIAGQSGLTVRQVRAAVHQLFEDGRLPMKASGATEAAGAAAGEAA